MRFIAHTGHVGLYFVYKPRTRFIFKNINLAHAQKVWLSK